MNNHAQTNLSFSLFNLTTSHTNQYYMFTSIHSQYNNNAVRGYIIHLINIPQTIEVQIFFI